MLGSALLGLASVTSLVLLLWQWRAGRRFPLHYCVEGKGEGPPVTLLKPLKGADSETRECLESWLRQRYRGPVQILFGVAAPEDPVCPLVRDLLRDHPGIEGELVICAENLGANAKVSTLVQLRRRARHEVLVVSDADVAVSADFLTQIVASLGEPNAGLAHCLYRQETVSTGAMRWEAAAVNCDFWTQVLQAQSLGRADFALGAVMALRRSTLEEAGGFEVLADYLADDYRLGQLVASKGRRVVLCPIVVGCRSSPQGWREIWRHQVRWGRTIRVCQPVGYGLSILGNATLWPLLWAVLRGSPLVWGAALGCWVLRSLAAIDLHRRFTGRASIRVAGWILVKDLLQVAVWGTAFLGSEVQWRGRRYRIGREGKLE